MNATTTTTTTTTTATHPPLRHLHPHTTHAPGYHHNLYGHPHHLAAPQNMSPSVPLSPDPTLSLPSLRQAFGRVLMRHRHDPESFPWRQAQDYLALAWEDSMAPRQSQHFQFPDIHSAPFMQPYSVPRSLPTLPPPLLLFDLHDEIPPDASSVIEMAQKRRIALALTDIPFAGVVTITVRNRAGVMHGQDVTGSFTAARTVRTVAQPAGGGEVARFSLCPEYSTSTLPRSYTGYNQMDRSAVHCIEFELDSDRGHRVRRRWTKFVRVVGRGSQRDHEPARCVSVAWGGTSPAILLAGYEHLAALSLSSCPTGGGDREAKEKEEDDDDDEKEHEKEGDEDEEKENENANANANENEKRADAQKRKRSTEPVRRKRARVEGVPAHSVTSAPPPGAETLLSARLFDIVSGRCIEWEGEATEGAPLEVCVNNMRADCIRVVCYVSTRCGDEEEEEEGGGTGAPRVLDMQPWGSAYVAQVEAPAEGAAIWVRFLSSRLPCEPRQTIYQGRIRITSRTCRPAGET
jgi:hypothetical protein